VHITASASSASNEAIDFLHVAHRSKHKIHIVKHFIWHVRFSCQLFRT